MEWEDLNINNIPSDFFVNEDYEIAINYWEDEKIKDYEKNPDFDFKVLLRGMVIIYY